MLLVCVDMLCYAGVCCYVRVVWCRCVVFGLVLDCCFGLLCVGVLCDVCVALLLCVCVFCCVLVRCVVLRVLLCSFLELVLMLLILFVACLCCWWYGFV